MFGTNLSFLIRIETDNPIVGCVTCKAKRLKCDELKPTCEQCAKRNVPCGGYKKDFKWRPFEEPNYTGKQPAKARKGLTVLAITYILLTSTDSILSTTATAQSCGSYDDKLRNQNYDYTDTADFHHTPPQLSTPDLYIQHPITPTPHASFVSTQNMYATPMLSPFMFTPQSVSPVDSYAPAFQDSLSIYGNSSFQLGRSEVTAPASMAAGQSPRLMDLLLPGTDHCAPPEEYFLYRNQHEAVYHLTGLTSPQDPENTIEKLSRDLDHNASPWSLRQSSPTLSTSSNSSTRSDDYRMLPQPQLTITSPEAISRRFNRDTCGVLSVKDGPTENPWRTLVWPLARDCPALYHAIASMTSFHQSSQFPRMRIQGIDHMRTSVHALAEGIQNMRFDAAISTTLILAFAESWDVHISTGINHIKGAKVLINQALVQHRQIPKQGEEWTRLKFLCNTWIYMDVIARLTSADDDDSNDVDTIYNCIYTTGQTETSVDPLMGCAHSLFPIIGRVATLVRKVRRTSRACPELVTQALHLKSQLEQWTPPSYIENPEDETISPRDSVKTAAAYQYATLLYLHQAIPEIPSLSAFFLAKRTLSELAAVEPSSRSCIIHIYPLMAAGCEMVEDEDRAWVTKRWELLSSRMKLGIIEKSMTVTKEVWARRDAYAEQCNIFEARQNDGDHHARLFKRNLSAYLEQENDNACWLESMPKRRASDFVPQQQISIAHLFENERQRDRLISSEHTELLDPRLTVKGCLHWLGVMQDWNWEGKNSMSSKSLIANNHSVTGLMIITMLLLWDDKVSDAQRRSQRMS